MKKRQVHKAELGALISAYSEAAKVQAAATETGDYKTGNTASELLAAIYSELRRRGRESQWALLPLLGNDDPGVRLWSASHALEFAPSDGEQVLRALIPIGKLVGLSARTTLEEWRRGRLRFP
jgi:hypothetical protein